MKSLDLNSDTLFSFTIGIIDSLLHFFLLLSVIIFASLELTLTPFMAIPAAIALCVFAWRLIDDMAYIDADKPTPPVIRKKSRPGPLNHPSFVSQPAQKNTTQHESNARRTSELSREDFNAVAEYMVQNNSSMK